MAQASLSPHPVSRSSGAYVDITVIRIAVEALRFIPERAEFHEVFALPPSGRSRDHENN